MKRKTTGRAADAAYYAIEDAARAALASSGGWMVRDSFGWRVTTDEGTAIDLALPLYGDDRAAAERAVRAASDGVVDEPARGETTGPTPGPTTGRGPGFVWLTLTTPNGRKVTIQADRLNGDTECASAECVVGMYAAAPDLLAALRDDAAVLSIVLDALASEMPVAMRENVERRIRAARAAIARAVAEVRVTRPTTALWRGVADRLDAGRVPGVCDLLGDLVASPDTKHADRELAGMALDRIRGAARGPGGYDLVAVEEVADLIRWHAGIPGWERGAHRPGPWASRAEGRSA